MMGFGKITMLLILILLLVTLSGCTQPDKEAPAKEPPAGYSQTNPDNTDIRPAGTSSANDSGTTQTNPETVNDDPEQTTFEEDVCNAAEDADACDTKLEELGIMSKDDCCQIYGKCC